MISGLVVVIYVMKESCPTLTVDGSQGQRQASVQTNNMLRLFYQKRLCQDLAKAPRLLNLSAKESVEAIKQVNEGLAVINCREYEKSI